MTYLILLSAMAVIVGLVQLQWAWTRRRKSVTKWEDLVAEAQPVDLRKVQELASGYTHPGSEHHVANTSEMWGLMGGVEGMNGLYRNAELMLELAVFAEQWNHPDAALIAELIRRDGVRVKNLITRIQLSLLLRRRLALDMQEAAAAYLLMRSRLLALYQTCHIARVPSLAASF